MLLKELSVKLPSQDQAELDVELFLGDGPDAEQSSQWISARVSVAPPANGTFWRLQVEVLKKVSELAFAEKQRIEGLHLDSPPR